MSTVQLCFPPPTSNFPRRGVLRLRQGAADDFSDEEAASPLRKRPRVFEDMSEALSCCAPTDFDGGREFNSIDSQLQAARREFYSWSDGQDTISGESFTRLATHLGWPSCARPDFVVLVYAVFSHSTAANRTCKSMHIDGWTTAMIEEGASGLTELIAMVWLRLQHEYANNGPKYTEFHRFVFTFLVISSEANSIRTPSLPRHAGSQLLAEVSACLRGSPYGTFCRIVSVQLAKTALVATLGALSPFTMSFCCFLDQAEVEYINLDQWSNFILWSRTIHSPSLTNYRDDDCWPCLYDDYVAWMRKAFPGHADLPLPPSPPNVHLRQHEVAVEEH